MSGSKLIDKFDKIGQRYLKEINPSNRLSSSETLDSEWPVRRDDEDLHDQVRERVFDRVLDELGGQHAFEGHGSGADLRPPSNQSTLIDRRRPAGRSINHAMNQQPPWRKSNTKLNKIPPPSFSSDESAMESSNDRAISPSITETLDRHRAVYPLQRQLQQHQRRTTNRTRSSSHNLRASQKYLEKRSYTEEHLFNPRPAPSTDHTDVLSDSTGTDYEDRQRAQQQLILSNKAHHSHHDLNWQPQPNRNHASPRESLNTTTTCSCQHDEARRAIPTASATSSQYNYERGSPNAFFDPKGAATHNNRGPASANYENHEKGVFCSYAFLFGMTLVALILMFRPTHQNSNSARAQNLANRLTKQLEKQQRANAAPAPQPAVRNRIIEIPIDESFRPEPPKKRRPTTRLPISIAAHTDEVIEISAEIPLTHDSKDRPIDESEYDLANMQNWSRRRTKANEPEASRENREPQTSRRTFVAPRATPTPTLSINSPPDRIMNRVINKSRGIPRRQTIPDPTTQSLRPSRTKQPMGQLHQQSRRPQLQRPPSTARSDQPSSTTRQRTGFQPINEVVNRQIPRLSPQ